MARIKIDPTCRYGHGPLGRVPGSFALEGVNSKLAQNVGLLNIVRVINEPNGSTLTVNAYWCGECGYTELQEWRPEEG